MSRRHTWVCDRCKAEAPESIWGTPEGWACGHVIFKNLPKMDGGRTLDLCASCQDDLKRVWDECLNPPTVERIAAGEAHFRQWWAESLCNGKSGIDPAGFR